MKNILGLDLGTNSIGWAVVGSVTDAAEKEILAGIKGCGSRIIPMDASQLKEILFHRQLTDEARGRPVE